MLSSKGNEEQKVTKKPSGKENQTFVVGMGVVQHTKGQYSLEENGQAKHDVNQNEYMVIKAYNNTERDTRNTGSEIGD